MSTYPARTAEQSAADYAAMMKGDPKAADLYRELAHNGDPDPYTYPNSSDRDEARLLAEVSMSKSNRVMKGVLDEAANIVTGDRLTYYGPPEINHKRSAELWSTYLGIDITPRQVCVMNILQKISRDVNIEKPDNLVDIIGYAANAAACHAAQLPVNGT